MLGTPRRVFVVGVNVILLLGITVVRSASIAAGGHFGRPLEEGEPAWAKAPIIIIITRGSPQGPVMDGLLQPPQLSHPQALTWRCSSDSDRSVIGINCGQQGGPGSIPHRTRQTEKERVEV